jgi:hypothetical protein
MLVLRRGFGAGWYRPAANCNWWEGRGTGWWVDPYVCGGFGTECPWHGSGWGRFRWMRVL